MEGGLRGQFQSGCRAVTGDVKAVGGGYWRLGMRLGLVLGCGKTTHNPEARLDQMRYSGGASHQTYPPVDAHSPPAHRESLDRGGGGPLPTKTPALTLP